MHNQDPSSSIAVVSFETMSLIEALVKGTEEGPQPVDCNPKIFSEGTPVFMTHTIPSSGVEWWVQEVAKESGQAVDWHYQGGRARVLALGDVDKVKEAISKLMPQHDLMMKVSMEELGL